LAASGVTRHPPTGSTANCRRLIVSSSFQLIIDVDFLTEISLYPAEKAPLGEMLKQFGRASGVTIASN
jgi:hypothetical protein